MAKQPKMDGAQNQQGQDTELGEEGGGRQGWGRSLGGKKKGLAAASLEGLLLTLSPWLPGRGLVRALFRIQAKEEPELCPTLLEGFFFSPTASC